MLLFPTYVYHDAHGARKNQAVAQAVTSWNEWLTYKGVSEHISALGEKQQDKNTPGSRVSLSPADQMGCCQRREAKLSSECVRGFSTGWVENHNMSWEYTLRKLYETIYYVIYDI